MVEIRWSLSNVVALERARSARASLVHKHQVVIVAQSPQIVLADWSRRLRRCPAGSALQPEHWIRRWRGADRRYNQDIQTELPAGFGSPVFENLVAAALASTLNLDFARLRLDSSKAVGSLSSNPANPVNRQPGQENDSITKHHKQLSTSTLACLATTINPVGPDGRRPVQRGERVLARVLAREVPKSRNVTTPPCRGTPTRCSGASIVPGLRCYPPDDIIATGEESIMSHLRKAVLGMVMDAIAAGQGLVTQRNLSLPMAKTIAEAALAACKTKGFSTSVAVVDRAGQVMVILRDENASSQTAEMGRASCRERV